LEHGGVGILKDTGSEIMDHTWWKEAVVYQIYPRSFYDTNGDGIGDLCGIIQKLDYLKNLGVDVLWLCPVYKSPNDDNGYDISDYYDIMDELGTMNDFEELLSQAHLRGLKIVMDLVVNHTSDEHSWFTTSRSSKENDKRDYYIWRKGFEGREPNNWSSFFTPSAWTYDETTDEYYLHLFSEKQPDLNWENPKLREEIYSMMTWWLDKGVDGFRMDVINCICKQKELPSVLPYNGGYKWAGEYFFNVPEVHNYIREMNERVLSKYEIMTVGETPGVTPEQAALFTGNERNELNMVFQSELMDIDAGNSGKWENKKWKLPELKQIIGKWQNSIHNIGWNSIFLGNHDQPRSVSHFGNDSTYRKESAELLATLLLTLQGTPYIFQGDEIGMTNVKFESIDKYRDIETLNFFRESLKMGTPNSVIMQEINKKSRDNARTPMQWNAGIHAGFTEGEPWIKENPNYFEINVEKSESDEDSILNYYKRMINIRKANPVLIYGRYIPLFEDNETVFAYMRKDENYKCLILLNFSNVVAEVQLTADFLNCNSQLLIGNIKNAPCKVNGKIELKPYEARVYNL
jgi:oligo-1,6-glucosidase